MCVRVWPPLWAHPLCTSVCASADHHPCAGRPQSEFKETGVDRAVLRLRFEHHETRRREKLQIAIQEREAILEEESRGEWVPPGKVAALSSLCECIRVLLP